jgi:hypothetical protein
MPPSIRNALGLPPLDPETKAQALADPGPSWKEWFFYEFARAWIILGFFIADSVIFVLWAVPFNGPAMATSLVGALYLEFLAYRVLWYRANPDEEYRRVEFHRTWTRPVQFGLWTPEFARLRRGVDPMGDAPRGPDPAEFL